MQIISTLLLAASAAGLVAATPLTSGNPSSLAAVVEKRAR